nr:unnamed protein product [Haemonchus contortus]
MESSAEQQFEETYATTSTTTPRSEDNKTNYTQFFVLLVSSILTLAALICVARILFVYCAYKRREQDEQNRRTQTRNVPVASQHNHGYSFAPESGGVSNYGFADAPPGYDELFKREEPPPLYGSVRSSQIITDSQQLAEPPLGDQRGGLCTTPTLAFSRNVLSDTSEADIAVISQRIQIHTNEARQIVPANIRAGIHHEEMPPS